MAYSNSFTIIQVDPPKAADQNFLIVLEFTGAAGEPTVHREFMAGATTTAEELRTWAFGVVAELNSKRTNFNTARAAVGQTLTTLAPTTPTPTAEDIWRGKVARYLRMQQVGLTGQTAVADLAALKSDIEATYDSAYL